MSRDLSVVIPAYNEAARIGVTLDSVASYLDARSGEDEVIVVDDGSTDDTQAVVSASRDRFRHLRLLPAGFNGGKGRAVRLGMLAATGRHRLFLDADNSTDIRELDGLLAAAAAEPVEPAVIIGSIADTGSVVARRQSRLRSTVGRAGNRLIQTLVLPGIEDSQRGFKVFSGPACDQIFRRCRVDGWAFDVEVLAIARALGYHVLEVPITWRHCDGSRVRPTAYLETLRDVLRIRHDLSRDRYDLTPGRSSSLPPS
jgi:dolichyl-phosphate beta-glucosyltransferase